MYRLLLNHGHWVFKLSKTYGKLPFPLKSTSSSAKIRSLGEVDRIIAFGQLMRFAYRKLQISTDNFNEINVLGQGGLGKVYKGLLAGGTEVTVKRLTDYESPGRGCSFPT